MPNYIYTTEHVQNTEMMSKVKLDLEFTSRKFCTKLPRTFTLRSASAARPTTRRPPLRRLRSRFQGAPPETGRGSERAHRRRGRPPRPGGLAGRGRCRPRRRQARLRS